MQKTKPGQEHGSTMKGDKNTYLMNHKTEKRIAKSTAKLYKRYRIWTPVTLILVFGGIAAWIGIYLHLMVDGEELAILAITFIPAMFAWIAACITYSAAVSGGRDILLARTKHGIHLDDEGISNIWLPRFQQLTPAAVVEYYIYYKDIEKIVYNEKFSRLELYCKRTVMYWKDLEMKNIKESKEKDSSTPYYIYCYFDNMGSLIEGIKRGAGLDISKA